MIELRNKRVLVVGLARSGRAVAHRLIREGAIVTVTDSRPPSAFGFALKELLAERIGMELGVHREETFLKQDLIVVSPGVPWDIPQLEAARRRRIMAVPEIEVASWFFQGTLAGITGTNGKTTTTTLLGKMLEASGFATLVAGNIGVPLISAVELFSPESIVVAELSSFQLEAIQTFRPHIAVLLNITANHLDRHHTFDAYVAAKAQIFRNQRAEDYALLNADDPVVMGLAPAIASRKVFFSTAQDLPEGVMLSHGRVLYRVGNLERVLFEEREIKLRGKFNVENVMAAAAAACMLGADFKAIRDVAREFTGVEHRLEFVAAIRGVSFYNDSKATSVDAAAKALSTFDRGVHLILGGMDKGAPYTPLKPLLEGRVKFIYLIGAAANKIAADLEGAQFVEAGDLKTAVRMALSRAISGDIVLLSPACSSYDQFEDFEQRGQMFKEIVHRIQTARISSPEARAAVPLPDEPSPPADPPPDQEVRVEAGPQEGPKQTENQSPEVDSTPMSPPLEPVYVYEVGGEEFAPEERIDTSQMLADEPAAAAPLMKELEPVSPYEVVARDKEADASRDQVEASSESAFEMPAGRQAELFPKDQRPLSKGK